MKRWETYRALTREIRGVRKPLIVLGLLKGWNLICGLVPLILYARLVDHVLVGGELSELGWIIAGYVGVFLLATVGIMIGKSFSNRLNFTFDVKVKRKLLTRYAALDRDTYRKYGIGDVKSRVESDAVTAGNFFTAHLLEFGYSVAYAIALAGILLVYDWRIALISFVFVPISLITVNALGRKTQKYGEELWRLQTGYESFLHTNFQNWKDVKINNLEDTRLDELNDHYAKIRRLWFMNQLYLHLGITYSFFTKNFITQLFVYFIGGLFVIQGYAEVGVLLIFVSYYGQFFGFIEAIGNSVMNFRNDSVSIGKVIEILNTEIRQKPRRTIKGTDVQVEGVRFAYEENGPLALDGISFSVGKGEHLAIAGKSGSGKSTIAKLLTGQIVPQAGSVRIGDTDASTVNSESLADKVSIVVQEPVLFNLSIRENLLLARDGATDTELAECCRRANIYDFIDALPEKWDTLIGEKGVRLSGGQKQRLSIARAFLQDRDIIIFDESTSALDSENENGIIQELRSLAEGKTLISIAHRLSTILDCDKVLVLQNGAVVAYGTHENLRSASEHYDLLFGNQYRLMLSS